MQGCAARSPGLWELAGQTSPDLGPWVTWPGQAFLCRSRPACTQRAGAGRPARTRGRPLASAGFVWARTTEGRRCALWRWGQVGRRGCVQCLWQNSQQQGGSETQRPLSGRKAPETAAAQPPWAPLGKVSPASGWPLSSVLEMQVAAEGPPWCPRKGWPGRGGGLPASPRWGLWGGAHPRGRAARLGHRLGVGVWETGQRQCAPHGLAEGLASSPWVAGVRRYGNPAREHFHLPLGRKGPSRCFPLGAAGP